VYSGGYRTETIVKDTSPEDTNKRLKSQGKQGKRIENAVKIQGCNGALQKNLSLHVTSTVLYMIPSSGFAGNPLPMGWVQDSSAPPPHGMARKDLEDNARKKLEDERLRRKEAKEAEWRAKYGFDKEDPLLKKKQQREEKKRNFWERCSGQETVPEEPSEASQEPKDIKDIQDIEEVKERISESLDDAWELPEAERKKAVKKLLLQ